VTETATTDNDGTGLSAQPGPVADDASPRKDVTETFDREYVQKLRGEAASHRVKAKRADALAASLVTATAALTGKLADATDLPYTDDLLDEDGFVDEDKVRAAVDELVKRKPHLAARRPTGNVGQRARPEVQEEGLGAMLRRGA
jgi:hypothetical protein